MGSVEGRKSPLNLNILCTKRHHRDPLPVSPASASPTARRERFGVRESLFRCRPRLLAVPGSSLGSMGNQARLAFSSRDLAPIPRQEKRAQPAVSRRRKCCCRGREGGGVPVRDSGKT